MKNLLLASLIGLWATGAVAHSPLKSTRPAMQAVIAQLPSEVGLTFKGKIRLTRVKMTYADQPSVSLDLSGHSGFISAYALPFPGANDGDENAFGAGLYLIEWRGLGADGHAMSGAFRFTVQ